MPSKQSGQKPEPKIPDIYFDYRNGNYLMEVVPGRFMTLSASDVKNRIKLLKINTDLKNDYGLTHGDEILAKVQSQRYVDYAGPLAGYRSGFYKMPGDKRVLVTTSCNPVPPGKNKKCPWLQEFVWQLVNGQEIYLYSWLKLRWQSLMRGVFTPSQLMVFAGPAGCGKTFMQWIITQLLGGRSGKPYAYMTGQTNFNEDLAEAEHLAMGDEEASFDIRSRKKFAAKIKQLCVEPEFWIQGKGKKAITLETRRALSQSVNNEPEHMLVIPPLDSDMVGKITLLRCDVVKCLSDRDSNQKHVRDELPAFARFLDDYEIPKTIRDSRFGVKAFQDKELMEIVSDSSPEQQLLVIIDDVMWLPKRCGDDDFWRGTAEQLKVELLDSPHVATISRLLDWPSACGTYLARLSQKFPARFEKKRSNGQNGWLIRKAA